VFFVGFAFSNSLLLAKGNLHQSKRYLQSFNLAHNFKKGTLPAISQNHS